MQIVAGAANGAERSIRRPTALQQSSSDQLSQAFVNLREQFAVTVGLGSRNSSDAAGTRLLLLAAERAGMRFQRQESTEFRTPLSITLS